MSVKEGRILKPYEHVDHIDNDCTNDIIENLQILSPSDNNKKEAKHHGKQMVLLKCPNCKKIFKRERRQTFLIKKSNFTACSRFCATKFAYKLTHNCNDINILEALNENVVKEYTLHK